MGQATIERLIINSPYEAPERHWKYDAATRTFSEATGRRPAGYLIASAYSKTWDDPGEFIEIPLVNEIRPRVDAWRGHPTNPYSGVTGVTKALLQHWRDVEQRNSRFFFCQLEAIETLIWFVEAPPSEKTGIVIPSDGGLFERLCCKMATGSGKTVVMAMLIAWQVLNKVTYPRRADFSKNVLVLAPGLTVRNRLKVLDPNSPGNYFDEFDIVPSGFSERLRQGRVLIRNWHALNWDSAEQLASKRTVDKRGPLSNEAYVRDVLGEMASSRNIAVINDEAHHAWRVPAESKVKGVKKEEVEEATKWVGGLDRIHEARGILKCFDFSATPFAPSGKQATGEALFDWIVCDFGLNDAIESGLVKTPRVVIRDEGRLTKDYKSRFYHIYNDPEVKTDLSRKATERDPLPDLVSTAYYLLGQDWLETWKRWQAEGYPTTPVMISVGNRVETAARIKYAFDHKRIRIEDLCDESLTLHIDSRVLEMAESREPEPAEFETDSHESEEDDAGPMPRRTKKQLAEDLRRMVDTIGKVGQPGERIRHVISVGMLSEGWDARTVTHIMGLRAFSSQLLCEQVVGRGLRRTSYETNSDGMFEPEYVNIFGVPFTFLPHESHEDALQPPPSPKTVVQVDSSKSPYSITWPSLVRIEHTYKPRLSLDFQLVPPLTLSAYDTPTLAEMAPIVDGKPDASKLSEINLEKLGEHYRMQRIVFAAAVEVFDQMRPTWRASREALLAQLIKLVEQFIDSGRIRFMPPLFSQDELRRRILITLNMSKVVHHIWEALRFENTETLTPVFDENHPIRGTGDMRTWYTSRPCTPAVKSHINVAVFDSRWEATEALELDRNPAVAAWAKNDHLGFEIVYVYRGVVLKYRPDFLVRLVDDSCLVLEVKGQDSQQDQTKRAFLDEWVRAVNQRGGFGYWQWAVSTHPTDVAAILEAALEKRLQSESPSYLTRAREGAS